MISTNPSAISWNLMEDIFANTGHKLRSLNRDSVTHRCTRSIELIILNFHVECKQNKCKKIR